MVSEMPELLLMTFSRLLNWTENSERSDCGSRGGSNNDPRGGSITAGVRGPHLFVLLNLALLKHGEDVGGAAVSGCLPPLCLLWCLEGEEETG